jgi:hypothetical protein
MVTVDVSGDPLGTSKYAMTLFIRDHVSPFLEYDFIINSRMDKKYLAILSILQLVIK